MKVGIVGAGMIVNDLLSFISEIKEIELIAIIGRDESIEKLNNLSKKHQIKKVYTSYQEALNDLEIEFMYIALPNHLHYQYTKKALEANKNVICEKPFTTNVEELNELVTLAKQNKLFLFEAITNQYLPNYQKIKEKVNQLGKIKIVECNFSKYSSRYDEFKKGNILPTFDIQCAGGALMDLNVYNIHFVVGIFGKPIKVNYLANIEKQIDTSGILTLEYPDFKCVCIAAKDSNGFSKVTIQGDNGYLYLDSASSLCNRVEFQLNQQEVLIFDDNENKHRMYHEFKAFNDIFINNQIEQCYEMLKHSIDVMQIITLALKSQLKNSL